MKGLRRPVNSPYFSLILSLIIGYLNYDTFSFSPLFSFFFVRLVSALGAQKNPFILWSSLEIFQPCYDSLSFQFSHIFFPLCFIHPLQDPSLCFAFSFSLSPSLSCSLTAPLFLCFSPLISLCLHLLIIFAAFPFSIH